MKRKFKKVVLGLLAHITPSICFGRILRREALVYNSYIFSEQPFYGNYSTIDSHKNTVIENRDEVFCQDIIENFHLTLKLSRKTVLYDVRTDSKEKVCDYISRVKTY